MIAVEYLTTNNDTPIFIKTSDTAVFISVAIACAPNGTNAFWSACNKRELLIPK